MKRWTPLECFTLLRIRPSRVVCEVISLWAEIAPCYMATRSLTENPASNNISGTQPKSNEVFARMLKISCVLLSLLLFQGDVRADAYVNQAKKLFQKCVQLSNAFDPAVADLYSDSALIRNTHKYPNGSTRVMTLTGKQWKALVRQVMPLAKARNDKDTFSQVTYKRMSGKVKISANRYSLLKKYTSPVTMIVMPDSQKKWHIVEEYSESRP